MTDIVDAATRSRMMARIRGGNTRPERLVRSFLHRQGFRFRLHRRIFSTRPDIVLPKYQLAIFVHGCFWHRHPGCVKATTPSSNARRWQQKFEANVERDRRNMALLLGAGWRVFILWECAIDRATGEQLGWLPEAIRDTCKGYIEWPTPERLAL